MSSISSADGNFGYSRSDVLCKSDVGVLWEPAARSNLTRIYRPDPNGADWFDPAISDYFDNLDDIRPGHRLAIHDVRLSIEISPRDIKARCLSHTQRHLDALKISGGEVFDLSRVYPGDEGKIVVEYLVEKANKIVLPYFDKSRNLQFAAARGIEMTPHMKTDELNGLCHTDDKWVLSGNMHKYGTQSGPDNLFVRDEGKTNSRFYKCVDVERLWSMQPGDWGYIPKAHRAYGTAEPGLPRGWAGFNPIICKDF